MLLLHPRGELKSGTNQLLEILQGSQKLYETESIPVADKLIYEHFFLASCNWYIAEFDGQDIMFGYAHLGDPVSAEWGYISFQELKEINVRGFEVDRDMDWYVKKTIQIEKIVESGGV